MPETAQKAENFPREHYYHDSNMWETSFSNTNIKHKMNTHGYAIVGRIVW